MRFFDTNILVYAATSQDPCKQRIARELIAHALDVNGDGCTSMQALQEFTAVLVRKCPDARDMIEKWYSVFYRLIATEVTSDMVRNAIWIQYEYKIQYYDALMIAAAEKVGCHEILTEDLNDGQIYRGMMAVNPFKPCHSNYQPRGSSRA